MATNTKAQAEPRMPLNPNNCSGRFRLRESQYRSKKHRPSELVALAQSGGRYREKLDSFLFGVL